MKKIIKSIGNSVGIIFNREDCFIHDFETGDIIDLGDIINETTKIRREAKQYERKD